MTLLIHPTKEMPINVIESEINNMKKGATIERKRGEEALVVKSRSWGTLDSIQSLLAKKGIPPENMQTEHPRETSFVVGREALSDAA